MDRFFPFSIFSDFPIGFLRYSIFISPIFVFSFPFPVLYFRFWYFSISYFRFSFFGISRFRISDFPVLENRIRDVFYCE